MADGRTWRPDGKRFTPEISQLVHAFIDETQAELVEVEVALCSNELPQEVPHQRNEGPFVEVISHLDQLAKHLLRRQAWDELVFMLPSAKPRMPCRSEHSGYIMALRADAALLVISHQPTGLGVCLHGVRLAV